MNLSDIAKASHKCAYEHGWWTGVYKLVPDQIASKLCLIHSEVSEALEAVRAGMPKDDKCPDFGNFEIEMADAIIRIVDLTEKMGLDIEGAVLAKMAHNETRSYRHGGKQL